jgi:hypothetical protein
VPAALAPAASLRVAAPDVHWMFFGALAAGAAFATWATRATTRPAARVLGALAVALSAATAVASSGALPDRVSLFFLEHPLVARGMVRASLGAAAALAVALPLSRRRAPDGATSRAPR